MSFQDEMIRWQDYARESRTAINNHFMAYSAAILALQTTILSDKDVTNIHNYWLFLVAGGFALISISCGSAIVLMRLSDARYMAKEARYKDEGKPPKEIKEMRDRADKYSEHVEKLLKYQIPTFTISAVVFVFWLLLQFKDKFQ
ncbi:hypothetical protein [Methylophilus sp. 3sh_L]|uniref:hypothetical protein n=1 Tax=Methylophilus sp. 3sh_L TaxID=3377114 RepID=UPI00398F0442